MPEGEATPIINLHPLGWIDLWKKLEIPSDKFVDVKLDEENGLCILARARTNPDVQEETIAVTHGEMMPNSDLLFHHYRIVGGYLVEATVSIGELGMDDRSEIKKNRSRNYEAGLSIPSYGDAFEVLSLLGKVKDKEKVYTDANQEEK